MFVACVWGRCLMNILVEVEPPRKTLLETSSSHPKIADWKIDLISFWDDIFSGAMFVLRSVISLVIFLLTKNHDLAFANLPLSGRSCMLCDLSISRNTKTRPPSSTQHPRNSSRYLAADAVWKPMYSYLGVSWIWMNYVRKNKCLCLETKIPPSKWPEILRGEARPIYDIESI